MNDSGTRMEVAPGVFKDSVGGRGRYDLLPTHALRRLAIHYENGALKYSPNGWRQKPYPYMVCVNSLKRHLDQWIEGQNDEDHLAAVAWWACALLEYEEVGASIDDRPIIQITEDFTK